MNDPKKSMSYAEAILPYNPKDKYVPKIGSSQRNAMEYFLERLENDKESQSAGVRYVLKEHCIDNEFGWIWDTKKHTARIILQGPTIEDIMKIAESTCSTIKKFHKKTPLEKLAEQLRAELHPIEDTGTLMVVTTNIRALEYGAIQHFEDRLKQYLIKQDDDNSKIPLQKSFSLGKDVYLYTPMQPTSFDPRTTRPIGIISKDDYKIKLICNREKLDIILPIRESFLGSAPKTGQFDDIEKTKYPTFKLDTRITTDEREKIEFKKEKENFEKL